MTHERNQKREEIIRWAELTTQAYIDEFPEAGSLDLIWLSESFDIDTKDQKWASGTANWLIYKEAAFACFNRTINEKI